MDIETLFPNELKWCFPRFSDNLSLFSRWIRMIFFKLWWPLIPYIKLVSSSVLQALVTTGPLYPGELEYVLQALETTGPLYPGEPEYVLQALVTTGALYPGELEYVLQALVTTGPLYLGELECVLQALVTSGPLYPGEFELYFASFRYHRFQK